MTTRGRAQRKTATVEGYLAALTPDKRAALERLRETIRAAAPKAEECLSYGLPAFRLGSPLVAYGAAASHCALYVMSPEVMKEHAAALAGYDTSKGTIRFPPGRPLPAALVKTLVRARVAENARRRAPT